MEKSIHDPIAPDGLDPLALAPLAGNHADDDATVFQDDWVQADHGPLPEVPKGVPHRVDTIKPHTRVLMRSATIGTVNGVIQDPFQLLPGDPNRKSLVIQAQALSANATTYVLASSKSDCYNGSVAYTSDNGASVPTFNIDEHTGAVWVYSTDSHSLVVTVIAVTC